MRHLAILVSIDGMRPDGMMAADAPTLQRLRAEGLATLHARTVMPSVTLPCHLAMLRGVDVPRHGVTSNTFQPLARPVPSLFQVATDGGCRCGAFYNWGPLRDLYEPEAVVEAVFLKDSHSPTGDARVADHACAAIARGNLDFLFVYFGWTDECGHLNGWMSEPYLQAIADVDRCVGRVVAAAEATGRPLTVLVQSDHGGHGQSHGTEMDEDMTIPWVLWGTGITPGEPGRPVRIFDTTPTLAARLGLNLAREWEGSPVIARTIESS